MGYVNAIIERMDKSDSIKKFETFQVETASRKTFRQLTEHYGKLDETINKKADKISSVADMAKKKGDVQEQLIKKLQVAVLEINVLNKKIQQLVSISPPLFLWSCT